MNDIAEPATVLCDANVLYSNVMTGLIISLGSAELFLPSMDKPDSRRMDEKSAGQQT